MNDYELADYKLIGDISVRDLTTITLLGWVSKKLNGIEGQSPTLTELSMLIQRPPIGIMPLENKIEVIRKLEKLGIKI